MTATTEMPRASALPVEDLGRQARAAPSLGRVIATGFAGLFFALGFLVGGAWRGVAFCAVAARYGYWRGLGRTDEEIAAVIEARRAAAQPPPQPVPARA